MRPAIRNIVLFGRVRALNFSFTGASLPSGATLTRASTGWRVNSSGVIVSAATDVARFTYNPATLAIQGLLNEPARTNLVTTSQVWNGSGTTRTNYTVVDNSIAAPDGTTTAALCTENAVNGIHDIAKSAGTVVTASTTISTSGYFKTGSRAAAYLLQSNTSVSTAWFGKGFNLSTVALAQTKTGATGTLSSAAIVDAGGGFYRCSIVGSTTTTNTQAYFAFPPDPASITIAGSGFGDPTWAGDNASNAYLWGLQQEIGSLPSSYIPTVSATVTRAADVLTLSGIPNGTYNVDVVRLSGTTNLTGQVVSAGTFVVPTDVSPLQAVQNWVKTA